MVDMVDLDELDEAGVARLRSALSRWVWRGRSSEERRKKMAPVYQASLASRAKAKAAGIPPTKRRPADMTQKQLRDRGAKAAATRAERYPEVHKEKRCRLDCNRIAIAHLLCRTHYAQFRRSTLPLEDWLDNQGATNVAEPSSS